MTVTTLTTQRELAHRSSNGVDVFLLWEPRTNAVSIELVDTGNDTRLARRVDPLYALDAFYHPYVYLELGLAA